MGKLIDLQAAVPTSHLCDVTMNVAALLVFCLGVYCLHASPLTSQEKNLVAENLADTVRRALVEFEDMGYNERDLGKMMSLPRIKKDFTCYWRGLGCRDN